MFQARKLHVGRPKARTNWELLWNCKKLRMAVERVMVAQKQERG